MSAPTWPELETLMWAGNHVRLTERLADLDDASRKACVKPLKELSRSGEYAMPPRGLFTPSLAFAGAAVLPDARSTAGWLRRFPVGHSGFETSTLSRSPDLEALVDLLVDRDPPWLPALLSTLVDRLRFSGPDPTPYRLIDVLRRRLDLPPPANAAYVAMWVFHDWPFNGEPATGLLAAEPRLADVVPLVFDEDGAAEPLRTRHQLEDLVAEGLVDRDAVLDACLARLQRGGRPRPTNDFVAVHDALAPTTGEVADRLRDYLALLPPGSASTVAAMSQRELERLYVDGRVDGPVLVEASRSLLLRTEKKVLRIQLARLEAHVAAVPADAELVASAAAVAFTNPAADVRRTAAQLVAALAPLLGHATLEEIVAATQTLPPDLRAPLSTALGMVTEPTPSPRLASLTSPKPHRVVPMESAAEVVEELLAVLRADAVDVRGLTVERIVEALPRLAVEDPGGLRNAAAPVFEEWLYEWRLGDDFATHITLRPALIALLASCVGDSWLDSTDRHSSHTEVLRPFALARAVRDRPGVRVVALPSLNTGAITPDDLVDRLEQAARGGWDPDPVDLEQALLRLDLGDASSAAFASLGTPAADLAVMWIAHGGHRAPVVRQEWAMEYPRGYRPEGYRDGEEPTYLTVARCIPDPDDPLEAGPLWSRLSTWKPSDGGVMPSWSPETAFECWPLVLPHHRDLLAAHLLLELSRARTTRSQGVAALVALAEADGPVGEALLVGLGYVLAAKHPDARATAVDALLVLAARDQLDGAALGSVLATMVGRGDLVAKRLAGPLGDLARAGAPEQAWAAVTELLGQMLTRPAVPGLVDLLTTAAGVAELAAATGAVPGLAELAGRTGSSRQVVEARRLVALLEVQPA